MTGLGGDHVLPWSWEVRNMVSWSMWESSWEKVIWISPLRPMRMKGSQRPFGAVGFSAACER